MNIDFMYMIEKRLNELYKSNIDTYTECVNLLKELGYVVIVGDNDQHLLYPLERLYRKVV